MLSRIDTCKSHSIYFNLKENNPAESDFEACRRSLRHKSGSKLSCMWMLTIMNSTIYSSVGSILN